MPQEPREEEDGTDDNVMGQKDGDGWGQHHNPRRQHVVSPNSRMEIEGHRIISGGCMDVCWNGACRKREWTQNGNS